MVDAVFVFSLLGAFAGGALAVALFWPAGARAGLWRRPRHRQAAPDLFRAIGQTPLSAPLVVAATVSQSPLGAAVGANAVLDPGLRLKVGDLPINAAPETSLATATLEDAGSTPASPDAAAAPAEALAPFPYLTSPSDEESRP